MTTKKFYLALTEDTLDLATFINGGVNPQLGDRPTHLQIEINSPIETTTKIVDTHEFFGEVPNQLLVIGHHE